MAPRNGLSRARPDQKLETLKVDLKQKLHSTGPHPGTTLSPQGVHPNVAVATQGIPPTSSPRVKLHPSNHPTCMTRLEVASMCAGSGLRLSSKRAWTLRSVAASSSVATNDTGQPQAVSKPQRNHAGEISQTHPPTHPEFHFTDPDLEPDARA